MSLLDTRQPRDAFQMIICCWEEAAAHAAYGYG